MWDGDLKTEREEARLTTTETAGKWARAEDRSGKTLRRISLDPKKHLCIPSLVIGSTIAATDGVARLHA